MWCWRFERGSAACKASTSVLSVLSLWPLFALSELGYVNLGFLWCLHKTSKLLTEEEEDVKVLRNAYKACINKDLLCRYPGNPVGSHHCILKPNSMNLISLVGPQIF